MTLPKIIQVTLDAELSQYLIADKDKQPLASLSKLLKAAALKGYRSDQSLETSTEDFDV